ncbi:YbaK/EbsC family protein [Nitriliruptor alkaliphilus]|uniref:YbaK/EbsC family protein n=1 Tax=Nitriliruptor alkaliphilus TaxID=427918 RepID=UPI0009FA4864|nr:YbaK/EbsC family protein [Nitriliruptor alkaliphilus]
MTAPTDLTSAGATPPPRAVTRFLERARTLGLDPEVRTFPAGTRTAADAAAAIGCDVAAIVKSLVFIADGRAVLALTSGANRADEAALAAAIGASSLRKADADEVRTATGYAIGGTPPFGHDTPLPVACDRDLTALDEVWAAAGTPSTVFPLTPAQLLTATGARVAVFGT